MRVRWQHYGLCVSREKITAAIFGENPNIVQSCSYETTTHSYFMYAGVWILNNVLGSTTVACTRSIQSESTASSIAVFMCACQCACAVCKRMWFMRACIRLCVHIEPMHARRADYRVGLGAGNYCTVVKHHYSLICPLAPSVRLRTTSYTISTIPRTAPPTHPHTHIHSLTLTHIPSIHLLKRWLIEQHSSPHLSLHLSLIMLYFSILHLSPSHAWC